MATALRLAILSIAMSPLACGSHHGGGTRTVPAAPVSHDDGAVKQRLEATIRFLSDDLLEGRGTPSRGLDTAAAYLASELRAIGVEPAFRDGYMQNYTVGEYAPAAATVSLSIGGVRVDSKDFAFLNFGLDPALTPKRLDCVFVGHALASPEHHVDELSSVDLHGEAAIALVGAPWKSEPNVFGPEYSVGKAIETTVRGAALLVYVVSDFDSQQPSVETAFLKQAAPMPVAYLPELQGKPSFGLGPAVVISSSVFDRTLANATGATYAEWQQKLATGPATSKPLGVPLEIRIEAKPTETNASNVLGVIRGSDPALRDQWVVLTAHYDHLGKLPPSKPGEDTIFNGADDNASGTAAVLEIARRLALGPRPKRSVLVFFASGEERGLLGSAYEALHPVVPADKVVVDINVDMVGRSTGKVQGIAETSPELFQNAVTAGTARRIDVQPDQQPTWRLAYLSDDYHFARQGVPSIEFFTGMHEDYHQPTDEASKIRFDEMVRILEAISELATQYASGAPPPAYKRPAWFLTPE